MLGWARAAPERVSDPMPYEAMLLLARTLMAGGYRAPRSAATSGGPTSVEGDKDALARKPRSKLSRTGEHDGTVLFGEHGLG